LKLRVLLVSLAIAGSAGAAPTKRVCVQANADAQTLQQSGKWRAAREALKTCSVEACPRPVRNDCLERLDALERALPTLIFEARNAAGADLADVRVSMDGELISDHLDGAAIVIDPGQHTFTFERTGAPVVTKSLVVHEGDRGRHETVVLGGNADVAPPPPAPSPAPPPTTQRSAGSTQRFAGIVTGAAGAVGVGVGIVFGLLASSRWSSSEAACSEGACPGATRADAVSDHDAATSLATASTIVFGIGGALLATGIVLYVLAPKRAAAADAVVVRF
jgi:hypothetical protein